MRDEQREFKCFFRSSEDHSWKDLIFHFSFFIVEYNGISFGTSDNALKGRIILATQGCHPILRRLIKFRLPVFENRLLK